METMTNTTDQSERDWNRGSRHALQDLEAGADHRNTWDTKWANTGGAYRDGYANRYAAGIPA